MWWGIRTRSAGRDRGRLGGVYVLLLVGLAVYLGAVIGFARNLPRALQRDEAWRQDTELHPRPAPSPSPR
jgi:hypothetical protein